MIHMKFQAVFDIFKKQQNLKVSSATIFHGALRVESNLLLGIHVY